jgi:hypothetical protein
MPQPPPISQTYNTSSIHACKWNAVCLEITATHNPLYLAMKVEASPGTQLVLMPFFKPLSWRWNPFFCSWFNHHKMWRSFVDLLTSVVWVYLLPRYACRVVGVRYIAYHNIP